MKKIFLSAIVALYSTLLFAQGGETKNVNIDVNTGKGGGNWYASPWIWVVGAAVFAAYSIAENS